MSDIATRIKTGLNISLRTAVLTAVVLAVAGTGIYLAASKAKARKTSLPADSPKIEKISVTAPTEIKVIMGNTSPPLVTGATSMAGNYLDKIILSNSDAVESPLSIKNQSTGEEGKNSIVFSCIVPGTSECNGTFILSGFTGLATGQASKTYRIVAAGFANKSKFVPSCKGSSCLASASAAYSYIKVVRNTEKDCIGAGYDWDTEIEDCKAKDDDPKDRSASFFIKDSDNPKSITVQKGSSVTVGWVTSGYNDCKIRRTDTGATLYVTGNVAGDFLKLDEFLKKASLTFLCNHKKISTFNGSTIIKLSGWNMKGHLKVKVKNDPPEVSLFAVADPPTGESPVDGEITVAAPPENGVTVTWTAKHVTPGSCTIEEVEQDADPPVYNSDSLLNDEEMFSGTISYKPEKTADINLYCQDLDGKVIYAKPLKVFVEGVPWVKISADGCGLSDQTGVIAIFPGVPADLRKIIIKWESKNVESVSCKLSRFDESGVIGDLDESVDANGSKSFDHSGIVTTGDYLYVTYTIACANGQNHAFDSLTIIHSPEDSGSPSDEVIDPDSGTEVDVEVPGTDTGDTTTVVEPSTDNPDTSLITPVTSPAKVSSAADITYGISSVASPGKTVSLSSQCVKSSDKSCRVSLQFDNFKTPGLYQYNIKVNDKTGKNRSTKKVSMLVLGAGQEATQSALENAIASGLTVKQAQEMLVYSANRGGINVSSLNNILNSTSVENLLNKISNKLLNF